MIGIARWQEFRRGKMMNANASIAVETGLASEADAMTAVAVKAHHLSV